MRLNWIIWGRDRGILFALGRTMDQVVRTCTLFLTLAFFGCPCSAETLQFQSPTGLANASQVDLKPYVVNEYNQQSSISLYMIRSPHGLDWRSPSLLVKSTLKNSFTSVGFFSKKTVYVRDQGFEEQEFWNSVPNHPIGHLEVAIRCEGENSIYTGMTSSDDFEAPYDMFINGYGLGILMKTQEGKLEKGKDLFREIQSRRRYVGNIAELKFRISKEQCSQMKVYLQDYIYHGLDARYGSLVDRPLRGDGAGCAAFGMAFVRALGIIPLREEDLDELHFANEWRRTINISENYIGDAINDAVIGVFGLWKRTETLPWQHPGVPYRTISFWDPERIFAWIQLAAAGEVGIPVYFSAPNGESALGELPAKNISNEKMVGVEIDAAQLPIRVSPLWDVPLRLQFKKSE